MGDIYTNPPQSRNEAILRSTIDGTEYTDPPQSRIEDLLLELKEAIEEGGGGGGGTSNYNLLSNKPQINGTTLSGDKSTADLIPLDNGLEINSDGEMAVSLGDGLAFNADGEIENQTEANPESAATAELAKLKVGTSIFSVVTKAVNDLANYYTKSDVYTKTEVNNIAQARFQVVAELPVSDIQTNVIYLVPKSTAQTDNDYDEYIYALKSTNPDTYGWEKIGDTEIDLSGYVTTADLNTALADYTTTADLTTLLAGKQNTLTFDSTPTAQSTNPVTSGGIKTYVDAQGAKTVSGNPITITDAEGMNADHVVATITPTQTGSGTPSPSNVRPFTGFSSIDVTVADAPTDPTETKTYTVQLGDTYYQANIDVTSGVLRCEQKTVDLGSFEWTLNQNNRGRVDSTTSISDAINPSRNSEKADMLSDRYQVLPYYVNSQEGVDAWGTDGSFGVQGNSTNNKLYVRDTNFEGLTAAQVKTALTGSKILYKLATPIEIQLTPTQIALLENNNTITTNVSSLDITYQTNTAIGDTASALDKRVTSLESKVPNPPTTDGTYKLTVTVASGTPTYSWESAT